MLNLLRTRLQQGTRTAGFPEEAQEFPECFRGRLAVATSRCPDGCLACARSMPSGFIHAGQAPMVDVGACLFSPEEATACPAGAVTFTQDFRLASSTRQGSASGSRSS